MKKNNFDNRFNYYLCGCNNEVDIEQTFNIGLLSNNNNTLENYECVFMDCYDDVADLKYIIEDYSVKYNFDNVYVLKIPSYYMGWRHRDGSLEPFVPLFISCENNKCFIIPDLIYLSYSKEGNKYNYNGKYNPLYNPSGLQFADEQIRRMYRFGCFNTCNIAVQRKKYTYDELRELDENKFLWEEIMEHYSKNSARNVLRRLRRIFYRR